MDNVIYANIPTTLDIPAEKILESAKEIDFDICVVLGWTKDGYLTASSTTSSIADINYLLDKAKNHFINYDDS